MNDRVSFSAISDIVKKQFHSKDVEYCITFICCSTNLSNAGRQKIMAKQPHSQKRTTCKKEKRKLCTNGTCHEKRKVLSNKAIWCKSLDSKEKKRFQFTELNSKNHWIPKEKKSFCPNQQIGINHLVLLKNNIFCLAEQFSINHWILHKNKTEQNGLTHSILHKNKKEQNGISHLILKENFCLAEQNGIKYWILQTKIRLCCFSLICTPLSSHKTFGFR